MDALRAAGHEAVGSDVGSPAGGTTHYLPLDVRDPDSIASVLA